MAAEIPTDLGSVFMMKENFLQNDEWGEEKMVPNDLSELLDMETNFNPDDFINQLSDDLEMGMMDDVIMPVVQSSPAADEPWKDGSDGSDSGVDCLSVKQEPLSPLSLCSSDDNSLDSAQALIGAALPLDVDNIGAGFDLSTPDQNTAIGLEDILQTAVMKSELPTPPQTPPRDLAQLPSISLMQSSVAQTVGTKVNVPSAPLAPTTPLSPSAHQHTSTTTNVPLSAARQIHLINSPGELSPGVVIKQENPTVTDPKVHQVLNSKAKIQPKPLQSPRPLSGTAQSKPLVLTAEEFAKLTSQGVLKLQKPSTPTPQVKRVGTTHTHRPPPPPPSPALSVHSISSQDSHDVKVLKRQQRMIKNRESACLSRKRKKEYLASVEERLSAFIAENQKLKEENDLMKQHISQLQVENQRLKQTGVGNRQKGIVVLAVLFLVGLNIGPLSNIITGPFSISKGTSHTNSGLAVIPDSEIHHGRTLLEAHLDPDTYTPQWYSRHYPREDVDSTMERLKQSMQGSGTGGGEIARRIPSSDLMLLKSFDGLLMPTSMCPTMFNHTESQRIMNELTGFMLGHKEEMQRTQEQQKTQKPKPRKRYKPPRKLKAAMKGQYQTLNYPAAETGGSSYELQVFSGADRSYQNLLNTLQRRNDTFYVVSFGRDHLLLPATAQNKTTRPRMSLVMPAGGVNETMQPPDDSIAMMQIECEVTSTKLVHVHKSAIPPHLQENSTHSSGSQHTAGSRGSFTVPDDGVH